MAGNAPPRPAVATHMPTPARRTAGLLMLCAATGGAAEAPGVVSRIRVVSDKVEDVSSMAAWARSFITPGMSDEQKAQAVFTTVVKFRHQEQPPNEYLMADGHVHDPIKTFNVYGYGQCCCASCNIAALARHAGLKARGWGIINHSVPEVEFSGAWHLMDASLMTYFPKADGTLASVDEITAGTMAWYREHPELKGDDARLGRFMRNQGWKQGPEVLARSPFYDDNGWLMAATHGWYSTMQEYADRGKCFLYEYGYVQGYEVNIQLRRGERLVRNWSNRGLHVNQLEGGGNGVIDAKTGEGQLRYTPRYGDLAPGRIGNGTLAYEPPLADGGFRAGALQADNLVGRDEAPGPGPALRLSDPGRAGVYVLRMPCSYVYLGGTLSGDLAVGPGGAIAVEFSDNHGLDWKEIARVTASGAQRIDLKPLVYRRYDYRLRLTITGAGSGIDRLAITHDIQHSQRALPALAQGMNTVSLGAGAQEGTITVEGNISPEHADRNLLLAAFHPRLERLGGNPLRPDGGSGSLTLPVTTPGDLTRVRVSCHYRARDAKDGWDIQASFDGGATFAGIGHGEGGVAGNCVSVSADRPPAGTRSALVRFVARQVNTTCLMDVRIDADYAEPHGGLAPVQVTYVWDEAGSEKRAAHVLAQADDTWPITCAQKPTMKSLIIERRP
jgi:hypothetical protein